VTFLQPWLLLLALLVPLGAWIRARRGAPAVRFAPAAFAEGLPRTWRARMLPVPALLEAGGLLLVVVALARPVERTPLPVETEGIDIVLCLDTSSSMAERDLDPARTRLEVAKDAASRFVAGRPHDRIGLVCFARYPDLRCPFTLDHDALRRILRDVAMVARDGPEDATGIGAAVALAAKLLLNGKARSKVVILLTDGEENVATRQTPSEIAPVHAAQLCKELGVRVYAIAAGTFGGSAPDGRLSTDTSQVRRMAEACDGAFFEAQSAETLAAVYSRIDALEKAPIRQVRHRVEERFVPVLLAALALLAGARLIRATVLEVLP
jgi:Ca-activated chloride channel family protein